MDGLKLLEGRHDRRRRHLWIGWRERRSGLCGDRRGEGRPSRTARRDQEQNRHRDQQLHVEPRSRMGAGPHPPMRPSNRGSRIVVHPGSRHIARRTIRSRAGAEKYWPEDRWDRVLRSLTDLRPDYGLLLTGTRAERRFNDAIVARSGLKQVKNVADELPIPTLLPVLERAHSMISVATGPAHAAAARGSPTVALFGPASTTLFRPGGATTPAVAVSALVNGVQSITGITPEAVIAAWSELVRSTETRPAVKLSR